MKHIDLVELGLRVLDGTAYVAVSGAVIVVLATALAALTLNQAGVLYAV